MSDVVLSLRGFGVAFGPQIVLASIDLEIPARGITVIVGPTATGKSTLLRTLAGLNDPQPALRTWGEAKVAGRLLRDPEAPRPAMVLQSARLLVSSLRENLVSAIPDRGALTMPQQMDRVREQALALGQEGLLDRLDVAALDLPLGKQRRVSILRAALTGSPVVLVDEPTAGVADESECRAILALLQNLGESRALVVTTHHRGHARILGGQLALIAGGTVQERGETVRFLDGPSTAHGQDWLKSGHCRLPSPAARPEDLAEDAPPPVAIPPETREKVESAKEPRGFFWLIEGRLAGMPRPGIVNELDDDLDGIGALGVNLIINLEERPTVPEEALRARSIEVEHFPIPDMDAPAIARAKDFCAHVDHLLDAGRVVSMHCLAGLGRTGTMLAAYAIWRGASVIEAIDVVRSARPLAIQSEAQAQFLEAFAEARASSLGGMKTFHG